MYQIKPNQKKQNGWACFDIAVGVERADVVKYATDNVPSDEVRALLGREIQHAAALTAVLMNQEQEKKKSAKRAVTIFHLEDALKKSNEERAKAQALKNKDDADLYSAALPLAMHTEELRKLVNNYTMAHENMREAVAECNDALGNPDGARLSLGQLDAYFFHPDNQITDAYESFKTARDEILTPHEQAFFGYCSSEAICRQYINEHYDAEKWFGFQNSFRGEKNTSMVDVVAKMLQKTIVIHDQNNLEKVIYQTEAGDQGEIHICYNGFSHFMALEKKVVRPNNEPRKKLIPRPELAKPAEPAAEDLPPVLTPEDYSADKREDLLPGFSGGLYQGDAAISYMLDGLIGKLHFDIKTEVGEAAKWDDIKVTYADRKSKETTKICYIQSKHGFDKNSFLLPGNFYNKSGKATLKVEGETLVGNTDVFALPMYFEDWMNLKSTRDKKEFDKMEFTLFSNRSLCVKVPWFRDCFAGDPPKLTEDFIKGTGIYAKKKDLSDDETQKILFRNNLFSSLLNNTTLKNKKITDKQKEIRIKKFLSNVVFRVGQKHLDDIEQENKAKIKQLYPHANADAIYYAFRFEVQKWLRTKEGAESFTDDTCRQLLDKAAKKYLDLGAAIGHTNLRLKKILTKPQIVLARDTLQEKLQPVFEIDEAEFSLTLISGEPGSGKSFTVATMLQQAVANNKLILGEFLYLTQEDTAMLDKLSLADLKLLVIDLNDSEPDQSILDLIEKAQEKDVKLVILCREEYKKDFAKKIKQYKPEMHAVSYLDEDEIEQNINALEIQDAVVTIGTKQLHLTNNREHLLPVLSRPNYFCDLAQASTVADDVTEAESKDEPYIAQEIERQKPVFSLKAILKMNPNMVAALVIPDVAHPAEAVKKMLQTNKINAIQFKLQYFLDEYQKDEFDLAKIVQTPNKKDQKATCIIDMGDLDFKAIPEQLRTQLLNLDSVFFVTKKQSKVTALPSFLVDDASEDDVNVTALKKDLNKLKLPKSTGFVSSRIAEGVAAAHPSAEKANKIVIVAAAGSGKTTFTKTLLEQWEAGQANFDIPWICRIRLAKLRKEDNAKSLEELVLSKIATKLSPWKKHYILEAIKNNKLVIVLDGWDEVKAKQQKACGEILKKLFAYPNIIATTRPNDFDSIPLSEFDYVKLLPFDIAKIRQYVQGFFGENEFSEMVCNYLEQPNARQLYDLIGVPMQCFLLCKALEPHYQQWQENNKLNMPWDKQPLSKSRLYQLFIMANLKSYLIKHEGFSADSDDEIIMRRCRTELKRLQKVAFAQIFETNEDFTHEKSLDPAISYFGFVDVVRDENKVQHQFKHQTYAEYFAALNIANKLLSSNKEKKQEAITLIKTNKYAPQYRLVWQFLAGILSYGDVQLEEEPSKETAELFWSILFSGPTDFVGVIHNNLLRDCLRNSNWPLLQTTKFNLALSKLHEDIEKTSSPILAIEDSLSEISDSDVSDEEIFETPKKPELPSKTVAELITDLNLYFANNQKALSSYNGGTFGTVASKITVLAKAAQNDAEKERVVDYLLEEAQKRFPYNCFVIHAAIAEAIKTVGFFNAKVEKYLSSKMSSYSAQPKIRAVQAWIDSGTPLNETVIKALHSASNDSFNGYSTWIARAALDEIKKIQVDTVELVRFLLNIIKIDGREIIAAAIFSCLAKAEAVKEATKKAILDTTFNKKLHAYAYVALCHLGDSYQEEAIDGIVDNDLTDLLDEIPFLLDGADEALIDKTIEFLVAKNSNYKILDILRELLEKGLIAITDERITNYIAACFENKNLTVSAIQLLLDHSAIDAEIITKLLTTPFPGFGLIDGAIPAIACLSEHLNDAVTKYLTDIIQYQYSNYGVTNELTACCKKLAESMAEDSAHLGNFVAILKALFLKIENERKVNKFSSLVAITASIDAKVIPAIMDELMAQYTTGEHAYLTLLMLIAKNHSLAVTIESDTLSIIGSNLNLEFELEDADETSATLVALKETLQYSNILPETIEFKEAKAKPASDSPSMARAIGRFSSVISPANSPDKPQAAKPPTPAKAPQLTRG